MLIFFEERRKGVPRQKWLPGKLPRSASAYPQENFFHALLGGKFSSFLDERGFFYIERDGIFFFYIF